MKKLLLTLPIAAAALLVATSGAFAQGDKPKGQRVDPAERLKTMTEKLSLTEEQQGKVKDVMAKNADKAKEIRKDTALSDEDRRAKMQEHRKAEMQEIRALLTPEQQEKLKEMRPTRAGKGKAK